jgi:CheY-like chemotaxis protein
MMSALGHHQSAQFRELGILHHLTKPVAEGDLLAGLLEPLNGATLRASDPPAREESETSQPLRILVAEDNHVNQLVARRLLERAGHSVVLVGNGLAAVHAVESGSFDLVLMDVQMPDMDGFEAARRIRQHPTGQFKDLPIFALTAHALDGDRERCLAAGMNDYLTKPLQSNVLLEKLSALGRAKVGTE